jgi:AmmeMemoRadiSam system protein B
MLRFSRRFMTGGVLASVVAVRAHGASAQTTRIAPLSDDPTLFQNALDKERPAKRVKTQVTGITVPHHLLAADLIARGVWAAAENRYDRIIVMSPDHFRRSHKPVATTPLGFDTPLGAVEVDHDAVGALLAEAALVENSDLFLHEHGVLAILPFLAGVFPGVPVVPMTFGIGTTREQWDAAVALLKPIASSTTLVVQSTDFSHYLLPGTARDRDQETLNLIAVGAPADIATLNQSNHIDSKAAQYVQLRLQQEAFGSHQVVVANRNSSEYVGRNAPSTSYVVSVFGPDRAALSAFAYAEQEISFFGGDVFLGRWFDQPLTREHTRKAIVQRVLDLTGGGRLVINLEGAIALLPTIGVPSQRHVMEADLALPMLQAMNVRAASLANNHSFDLGPAGVEQALPVLSKSGIRPLRHMEVADLGAFRLLTINFIGDGDHRGYPVMRMTADPRDPLSAENRARISELAKNPPLIVFVHWGREFTSTASDLERNIAEDLAQCGANLVVGAHTHQSSASMELIAGGESLLQFSLGNLLFDQRSPMGSGALLEVRAFSQKTLAMRLVPIPNLYEFAVVDAEG